MTLQKKIRDDIIEAALRDGRKALFEHEAKALVRSAGIMTPKSELADPRNEQAILAAGEKLGFPVALKAVSPGLPHKTEAGAVMLDIRSGRELAAAAKQVAEQISRYAPDAVIHRFLVEEMMPSGLELLIGGLRDEQFGPSVAFGLGGVWVEAFQDAVFGILPMTREEMLEMISQTRAGAILKGYRGAALDHEAVLSVIDAVSTVMIDHPAIRELDLNPLRLYAGGAVALDARVIVA